MPATLLTMAGKPKSWRTEARANFGVGTEEQRKEAKRKRDLDDSGADIKGNHRKPSRPSKAEKRRIEEEDRESSDKAMRASRDSPAPKRKNDNTDLDEEEEFGRFEKSNGIPRHRCSHSRHGS